MFLEVGPFQIGWYNQELRKDFDSCYQFDLPPETLAFVVISTPSYFQKTYLPFIKEHGDKRNLTHPVDECTRTTFQRLCSLFPPNYGAEPIFSFEKQQPKNGNDSKENQQRFRPRVLVQVAAHVGGVARLYRQSE